MSRPFFIELLKVHIRRAGPKAAAFFKLREISSG